MKNEPEPTATDDLVLRAKEGEQSAYERLFERVAQRLHLYIRLRLGAQLRDQLDADDALQEVYAAAHRAFPGFEAQGTGSFGAWIYRVTDNTLRDLARHHSASKRRPVEGIARGSQWGKVIASSQTGPSTAFVRNEASEQLEDALRRLPPLEREAILLRHFQEQTLAEIASALGHSETGVRRLLTRARLKLGAALRPPAGS